MGEDKKERAANEPSKDVSAKLDALKAMSEAVFRRWEKRRYYEWLLSISIWSALAAFTALALTKDFPQGGPRVALAAFVVGFIGAGLHFWYLWMIANHTLADMRLQRRTEEEIFKLAGYELTVEERKKFYPRLGRYGLVQALFTLLLAAASAATIYLKRGG